ncbi:glyoxylase-like metal-dependent hydrolase (beta-lactamase superfamily II) [Aminobacter aminovorans]|uniref:Ribonuclease Z n=1 Tax=Aminobacter aminovorans TaxID=83263 RepID=A0A381IM81_AMIAI|nr:MBL fold metallo-hydrolase [Aminobacter aminovorans]TCS25040.1 glyoxylase-like metal-dependent hydrolase (beta-lactamase superfamily II) [Aminobacter aminovorans]SUY28494.1 ribonuclease Z [Aminobacter aminovorans]
MNAATGNYELPFEIDGKAGLTVGEYRVDIVSDGSLSLGDPARLFLGQGETTIRSTLREALLSDTSVTMDQNIAILRTHNRIVLVDAGTGGAPGFGMGSGRLPSQLVRAGVRPEDVTDVLITHGHSDHLWGLTDLDGQVRFPNAIVHISEIDHRFFTATANDGHPIVGSQMEGCRARFAAVGDRLNLLQDGQEVLPGIVAVAAPGHTPGHMMYRLQSGKQTLLLSGDLAHHHVMFLRNPDIRLAFDADQGQMVETRKRHFDMLATDRIPFLSYHFPFPGLGFLTREGHGFEWIQLSRDSFSHLPATKKVKGNRLGETHISADPVETKAGRSLE